MNLHNFCCDNDLDVTIMSEEQQNILTLLLPVFSDIKGLSFHYQEDVDNEYVVRAVNEIGNRTAILSILYYGDVLLTYMEGKILTITDESSLKDKELTQKVIKLFNF